MQKCWQTCYNLVTRKNYELKLITILEQSSRKIWSRPLSKKRARQTSLIMTSLVLSQHELDSRVSLF